MLKRWAKPCQVWSCRLRRHIDVFAMQILLYFIVIKNQKIIKSLSACCWNTDNNPASNKSLIHVVCLFCCLSSVIGKCIFKSIFVIGSRSIWVYGRTKIRCLSSFFSVLFCGDPHHKLLLRREPLMSQTNIQQENMRLNIDFAYYLKIHYHILVGIVLVSYSRNREWHKIPESSK